jgi:hypothetical protein
LIHVDHNFRSYQRMSTSILTEQDSSGAMGSTSTVSPLLSGETIFAANASGLKGKLQAEPEVTAKALMKRLFEQFPDACPTGAQLRTLRRRLQQWRDEQMKRLIFQGGEI